MSSATLSNDDLLAIFAELPVATLLYCLPRMCRKWNSLLATACRARRVLILHDGNQLIKYIQYTNTFPYEKYLLKEDGSPYLRPLASGHPAELVLQNYGLSPSLAGHLVSLFSNIRHLYISMHPSTETLALAVPLIDTWGIQLTTVHLLYLSVDGLPEPATRKEAAHTLTSILEGINSCTSLKRLYFNVLLNDGDAADETAPIRLHLPVFNRVSSLFFNTANFTSPRDVNLPLNELRRHLQSDVGSLKRVSFINYVTLSELTQMEPNFARRFVRLNILDEITLSTLPTLALLCTRFTSLRSLGLIISVPMCLLVGALTPLISLVDLHLTYMPHQVPPTPAYGVDGHQASPVQSLRSVKSLWLWYSLPSHEQPTRLGLVEHFPAVQVAFILNSSDHCRDCGYQKAPGVPFDANQGAFCAPHALLDYFLAFPHLKGLHAPRRIDWLRWENTPLNKWSIFP